MPEAITELRKLERLDLTNNDLSGYDFKNPACQFFIYCQPIQAYNPSWCTGFGKAVQTIMSYS